MQFPDLTKLIPAGLSSAAAFLPGIRALAEGTGSTVDAVAAVLLPGIASLLPDHQRDAITLANLHEAEGIAADVALLAPQAVALEQRAQALVVKVAGELAS